MVTDFREKYGRFDLRYPGVAHLLYACRLSRTGSVRVARLAEPSSSVVAETSEPAQTMLSRALKKRIIAERTTDDSW